MAENKHPFGLKHDSRARKEKRGAGASLPGAATAGGAPAGGVFDSGAAVLSTIGRASPNGGASVGLWDAMVGAVSNATGLGTLAAGKAIVVGLVVGASSLTAAVSVYIGGSGSEGSMRLGPRVFVDEAQDEAPLLTPARPAAPAEPAATSGASLDYLSQANGPAPEPEAAVERKSDAPAAVATADAAAKQSGVPTQSPPPAAPAKAPADVPKPKMTKRAMPQARGDPGGKGVVLQSMDSLTGKVGAGFQEVYRPKTGSFDAMSQAAPRYGANRKIAVNKSGSNAIAQARFANRLSKSGARMSVGTTAAHTASQPFDGGNRAGALGNTRAAGTSLGGTGVSSSANGLLDSKSVEPPPAPDPKKKKNENKTPYQGMVMAAMAALMIGTVLLMIAGKMASDPAQKPAAQAVAAAAMAAGGAAAAMGGMIAGQYDQITQGMPFIMGGGILAVQAGMVIAKAEQAAEEGAQGVQGAGADAAGQAGQALSSAMGPAMQAMQGQDDGGDDKPKEEPKKPQRYDVHIDHSKPGTQGSINVPGL